jgi:hypothetical protein
MDLPGGSFRSEEYNLMNPRVNLIALPNVQTTSAYSLDGFCTATIRMAKLLKELDYYVTLYASEQNEAPCDELVTVITMEEQVVLLDGVDYQYAGFFGQKCFPLWALANVGAKSSGWIRDSHSS